MKTLRIAFGLLGVGFTAMAQQPAPVGIVQFVTGNWKLFGNAEPVKAEQLIYKGDAPVSTRPTEGRLVIGFFARAEAWQQTCTAAAPCHGPFPLPDTAAPTGKMAYLNSYMGNNAGNARPAVFAGARDAASGPRHTVLTAAGGRLELSSALSGFPAGRYKLIFTPLAPTAGTPIDVDLAWDGTAAAVPAVPPGFYALDAYGSDGDRIGTHAALLVLQGSDGNLQRRWQEELTAIQNASGTDALLAEKLRLATVLALRDRAVP